MASSLKLVNSDINTENKSSNLPQLFICITLLCLPTALQPQQLRFVGTIIKQFKNFVMTEK